MDPIDELDPELGLAFTCVAAVGTSMVHHFRIEDAKSCTRICRRILLCTATPPHSESTNLCALTCIDTITTATTLLTRRLSPLGEIDTAYLSIAQAAMASLRGSPIWNRPWPRDGTA